MAMQYAVRGCRYISQIISNKIDEDAGDHSSIRHAYDINKGAVKEAKQIVLHEHDLVDYYKNYKTKQHSGEDIITTLVNEWYPPIDGTDQFSIDENDASLVLIGNALSEIKEA